MLAGIVSLLNSNATLSNLIGANAIIPVGTAKSVSDPYVIYHISSSEPTYTASGATALECTRFQFDCYSSVHLTAYNVAVALQNAIKNTINTTLTDGTTVYGCVAYPPVDLTMVAQGNKSIEFRVMVEVEVYYLNS